MPQTTPKLRIPYPVASDRVSDYPALARTAAETIDTTITPTPWVKIPMSQGWDKNSTVQVRKIASLVEIRGHFGHGPQGTSGIPAGTKGQIATLPAQFRPTGDDQTYLTCATYMPGDNPIIRPAGIITIDRSGTMSLYLQNNAQSINLTGTWSIG